MKELVIAALMMEVKGLDPLSKYVFARYALSFDGTNVGFTAKEAARSLGVSESQAVKALHALNEAGVLSVAPVEPSGRGRPRRAFRLSSDYVLTLNRSGELDVPLQHVVRFVLRHELGHARSSVSLRSTGTDVQAATAIAITNDRPDKLASARASKVPGRLTYTNRLLLAVLLCRADRFGVVSDLGSAELCRLTGLNKERLRYRIQSLLKDGLIRAYVPGATSSILFKPTKSVYYLNLHHPELALGGDSAKIIAVQKYVFGMEDEFNEAGMQWREASMRPYWDGLFFRKVEQKKGAPVLQAKIDQYASLLLSRYRDEFNRIEKKIPELYQLIVNDFATPSTVRSLGEDVFDLPKDHGTLIRRLYYLARDKAVSLADIVPKNVECLLLPTPIRYLPEMNAHVYLSTTLLVLPKKGPWSHVTHVVNLNKSDGTVEPVKYDYEQDIPLNERYDYGLLTRIIGNKTGETVRGN